MNDMTTGGNAGIGHGGHVPQTGDIYLRLTGGYETVLRISGIADGRCTFDEYVFAEGTWRPSESRTGLSSLTAGEYYVPAPADILEIISDADRVFNGESRAVSEIYGGGQPSPAALVTMGASQLAAISGRSESLKRRAEVLSIVCRARKAEMIRDLDAKMSVINGFLHDANRQVDNIRKVVDMVEAYGGQNVVMTTVSTGEQASGSIPLSIRQRILFMDEEMAVLGDDCNGLDAGDIHLFVEWLGEPEHRDIIVPEQKCVVVMKPRRFDKKYTNDFFVNKELNRWNHHSFLVIRNGGNVSIVEYDNLCVFGSAVPRKADYEQIVKDFTDGWHRGDEKYASEATEDIRLRSMQLGSIIQGIVDRTGFFGDPCGMNVLQGTGVDIVYDDEADSLIGTGLTEFPLFIREKGKTIRRGTRVVYFGGRDGGEPSRWMQRMTFSPPPAGLYSVDEIGGTLGFRYLPGGEIWDDEKGWHGRTRKEGWHYYSNYVINFDDVTSEEIAAYLNDRTQRRYYLSIIPLLLELKRNKEKEEKEERLFMDCLLRDPSLGGKAGEAEIREAIRWWKEKVIFTRPLSLDDRKAYRMVKARLQE